MECKEFREWGHRLIDWMADYYERIEEYPVKSRVKPGEVIQRLPLQAPGEGEPFSRIFQDFQEIILPGITHWQSPGFFAYFNANASFPSILAEMLTSALGAQCMSWQTSPAAAELEERVMGWTAELIGLPPYFTGVIQDTASTASICSLLSAREKFSHYRVNQDGLYDMSRFTVYCSAEAHSSIEKGVKIIGLGKSNLRKIAVDSVFAMDVGELVAVIKQDLAMGFKPLVVVAALGTTGSTGVDPLASIAEVCQQYGIWLHVDAAYAGTALVLPEKRWMIKGIEQVDSFVFNPHKWMFTNFDCSAYFVKDKEPLIRTFEILPEYLKTREGDQVNNYRDWGIQLGRRFRALKLWFVLRSYGVNGIRKKVQEHITWAQELARVIEASGNFKLLAPVLFGTVCFHFCPPGINDLETVNRINQELMEILNDSGEIYLTHTKLQGKLTLRLVIGQTNQEWRHVWGAWEKIRLAADVLNEVVQGRDE